MTFEARSCRDRGLDHLVFDVDPRRHLAAAGPLLLFRAGFGGSVALSMPLGLMFGAALQTFQPGDLFALFADGLLQGGDFAEQFDQQSFKLCTAQRGKGGWRRHIRKESHRVRAGAREKLSIAHIFAPLTRHAGSRLEGGMPFIKQLPFSAILQQDIES